MSNNPPQLSTHPIHPWYGPCDGLGEGGECSECIETAKRVNAQVAWLEAELARVKVARDALSELREIAAAAVKVWGETEDPYPFDAEMMALDVWLADSAHPMPIREG